MKNDLPKDTAEIDDRRNELAGNLSLNQELAFVRRTNEMVRRFGEYVDGKMTLGDRSRPDKKEYRTIKVRRIEVDRFERFDYLSKLDRSRSNINKLTKHGKSQAMTFLYALDMLSDFETTWEDALRAWAEAQRDSEQDPQGGKQQTEIVVDSVANLFADGAKIKLMPLNYKLIPPDESTAVEHSYEGKELIRECAKWCLENNFNLEQARDYCVEGDKVSWWMLVTAEHRDTPIKGRIEVTVKDRKIECFTFYPLDRESLEKLEALERPPQPPMRADTRADDTQIAAQR